MGAERLNVEMANKNALAHLATLANMADSHFSDKKRNRQGRQGSPREFQVG
jgi:hypothetical protein